MARSSRRSNANVEAAQEAAREAAKAPLPGTAAAAAERETRPGAVSVDELRDRLVDLQATVERLVESTTATPDLATGDAEVDSAARTLRFAQQTADSVIAEARQEALAIVTDAERQRSEIIRRARQQADQDYTAERDEVMAASTAWQAQRDGVLEQLDGLAAVFAKFQDGVAELGGTVESVAAHLRSRVAAEPVVIAPRVHATSADDGDEGSDAAEVDDESDIVDAEVIDLTRRNPFSPSPVTTVANVDAGTDPFLFDVAELTERRDAVGYQREEPDSPSR